MAGNGPGIFATAILNLNYKNTSAGSEVRTLIIALGLHRSLTIGLFHISRFECISSTSRKLSFLSGYNETDPDSLNGLRTFGPSLCNLGKALFLHGITSLALFIGPRHNRGNDHQCRPLHQLPHDHTCAMAKLGVRGRAWNFFTRVSGDTYSIFLASKSDMVPPTSMYYQFSPSIALY